MKKMIIVLTGASLLACSSFCFAASTPAPAALTSPAPLSTLLEKAQAVGYSVVQSIKLEKNIYKIKAINVQGDVVKIEIDSTTGAINPPSKNAKLTLVDAIKIAEKGGYHTIRKADFDDGKYELKALNKEGKKFKLKIDAQSGALKASSEWF